MSPPRLDQPFVIGTIETDAGQVPRVSSDLRFTDHWGTFKARWGIGRMNYRIDPGLYAVGSPAANSPVLVSANYKMSFDKLRQSIAGRSAWVLVLDTKGINVWCAAGKGTFGTAEIVSRAKWSGLSKIISHQELILPQLAGPGVSAHQVKKLSGFKVVYGPIQAADLPEFLDAGLRASPDMRVKTFPTWDRAVLIPVELVEAFKWALVVMLFLFVVDSLLGPGGFWTNARSQGLYSMLAILMAVFAGAVLTPLLLPWVPGRAFSVKGLILGILSALILLALRWGKGSSSLEMVAWFLLMPSISAYLAMNFTGSSTYTSLSGVKKEMRWAVPLQIGAGAAGLLLWIGSHLIS